MGDRKEDVDSDIKDKRSSTFISRKFESTFLSIEDLAEAFSIDPIIIYKEWTVRRLHKSYDYYRERKDYEHRLKCYYHEKPYTSLIGGNKEEVKETKERNLFDDSRVVSKQSFDLLGIGNKY